MDVLIIGIITVQRKVEKSHLGRAQGVLIYLHVQLLASLVDGSQIAKVILAHELQLLLLQVCQTELLQQEKVL